jgi:hypothetical protein
MLRRHFTGISLTAALLAALGPGCGDSGGSGDDGDDGTAPDATPVIDATLADAPPALCDVQVTAIAAESGVHLRPGEPITFSSNPPATGNHYSVWARWGRTYPTAVPRGYWVHNLEHGGVVFLHNCPDGCADDIAAVEAMIAGLDADARCAAPLRTRTLITPDPELPAGVRFAAAAWNWTYTSPCLDLPSLRAFAVDHYAQGNENTCAEGAFPAE